MLKANLNIFLNRKNGKWVILRLGRVIRVKV